jgi:peptidoglycan hydrolase CwlO-like protein
MKKRIYSLAIAILMIGSVITSCKSNNEKVQDAENKVDSAKVEVAEAQQNLDEAKRTATAEEWQAFKDSTNAKIDENNAKIEVLKADIKKKGNAADESIQKNINEIKEKNEDFKVRITSYKNDTNSDWNSFKREFNHDMDDLGRSLNNLTVDNKK